MKDLEAVKAEIMRRSEIMKTEKKARVTRITAIAATAAAVVLAVGIIAVTAHRDATNAPSDLPGVIESTDTAAPQQIRNDPPLPNGGGGPDVCGLHNPAYHMADVFKEGLLHLELGLDYGQASQAVEEWLAGLSNDDPDPECLRPDCNVLNFIEHFKITREQFEDYLARNYYLTRYYFDLDAIYGDDPEALQAWIGMSETESASRIDYKQRNVFTFCKYELVSSVLFCDKYFDKWQDYFVSTATDYWLDYTPGADPSRIPADEVRALLPLDPYDEEERSIANYSFTVRDEYGGLDYGGGAFGSLTIAGIVHDIGLAKEDAEYYFKVGFSTATDGHGEPYRDTSDCWRVDFDKLYANLDYYADLLGAPGYEYPYLVDAEYLIKTSAYQPPANIKGNDDPPAGRGGGWICVVHNPAYHGEYGGRTIRELFFCKFLTEIRGLDESVVQAWLDKYPDIESDGIDVDPSVCPCEGKNIRNFINDFGVTREEFERFLAAHADDGMLHYYDVDAIFGDDVAAFDEWAVMNHEISRLMTLDDPEAVYRIFRAELCMQYNGELYDPLPIAYLLKKMGISRAEAESRFDRILEKHDPLTNGCWTIDFDKLYANLDEYAARLGEDDIPAQEAYDAQRIGELYELCNSIDLEYLVKD